MLETSWCGGLHGHLVWPLSVHRAHFKRLSEEHRNVVFLKVDVDEAEDVAQKYGINAMPTFFFFKNGNKIDSLTGAVKNN
ncbi:thioredoxin-like [Thalassophryne amazonica]|uniref:thioredoxin-like n=1 Tax=Thalassophryne amazonica TaxID=390379 RepID=UPI00147211FD|nr:thioredoxin-like [Thalassophryne amazonica]